MKIPEGKVLMDASYNLYYPEGALMTDDLPDELASVTPEIWRQYPPQHPMIIHFTAIFLGILWLINAVGNTLVIYVFCAKKSLRTPTNILIVNLALSDFCMMTTMGLPVTINACLSNKWIYGTLMCRLYGSAGALFGTVSLLTMVVIGYDRHNVIVKGLKGKRLTYGKAVGLVAVVWTYCLLATMPPFLGWGAYALDGLLITCNYDYYTTDWNRLSFVLYAFVTHYAIPVAFIFFYYIQIIRAVIMHESALRKQAEKMNVENLRSGADKDGTSTEMKVAKVAITNVCLWLVAWTPFSMICVICLAGKLQLVTPLVSQLPVFFAKVASCLNPVVFAMSHPKFREALAEKVPCLGIREAPSKDVDNATMMVSTGGGENA